MIRVLAGRSRRAPLVLLAALSLSLTITASAQAGEYDVNVCTPGASGAPDVEFTGQRSSEAGPTGRFEKCKNPTDGGLLLAGEEASLGAKDRLNGHLSWIIDAPRDTQIRSLFTERAFTKWDGIATWFVRLAGGRPTAIVDRVGTFMPAPPSGFIEFPVNGTEVEGVLECFLAAATCEGPLNGETVVSVRDVVAHMQDFFEPSFAAPLGGSLFSGVARGTRQLSFFVKDRGSGISQATLLIDGRAIASQAETNGGKCLTPYTRLEPCALQVISSFAVDTTALADGEHEAVVEVTDAGGLAARTEPARFTVANPASEPVVPVPSLSGASLLPRRVRLSGATVKKGLAVKVSVSSSVAAQLSLALEALRPHRPARLLSTLTRPAVAGANDIRLGLRTRGKPLAPGRYRVTVTARNSGGTSSPLALAFTVLAPPHR